LARLILRNHHSLQCSQACVNCWLDPPRPFVVASCLKLTRKGSHMPEHFTDAQIADFLRRSYFVVDGLWFVKIEERRGFEEAMALDEAVWDVMSKVQARKARALLGIEGGSVEDLARAFQLKLAAEGHGFDIEVSAREAVLTVRLCPWYEILKSSGRTGIAELIADRICKREFGGWAKEFGRTIEVAFEGRLCVESDQCETCRIVFRSLQEVL